MNADDDRGLRPARTHELHRACGLLSEGHVYFVLSSNIPGLDLESETFEEFVEIAIDAAPDLVGKQAVGSSMTFQREAELAG